jgi:hypothetical protein
VTSARKTRMAAMSRGTRSERWVPTLSCPASSTSSTAMAGPPPVCRASAASSAPPVVALSTAGESSRARGRLRRPWASATGWAPRPS